MLDLRGGTVQQRAGQTLDAIRQKVGVIYQGAFTVATVVDGTNCEVAGEPDFLIRDGDSYRIQDVKLARRINDREHPEIIRQLELYGWLYERAVAQLPTRLEVLSGTGEVVTVPYDGGVAALSLLGEIVRLRKATEPPRTPVGWTKCGGCGFHDRCWSEAEARRDVALVVGVDQGLAVALYASGIESVDHLLERLDDVTLADMLRPWGAGMRRVGGDAAKILRMAKALAAGQEIAIDQPEIPAHLSYAMFDLEGLPPHLDELERVYLWGVQVWGERPSEYLGAVSGFGPEGDRQGWLSFLKNAGSVFETYGDIPFVHWHHYERVKVDLYLDRFGDIEGIGRRVCANLVDLLPIAQKAVALPLSSYSLKAVERHVGFKRTQDEYGGSWAMAKYIEATETEDRAARARIIDEILTYNREDLAATWSVLAWLKARTGSA